MLTVGQELYYVPADRRHLRQACTVRVKKVGRKWAEIDSHMRIDINSLWVDGGSYSSPGRCWLNKEAWEAEERRLAAWDELKKLTGGYAVPNISEEAIRGAMRILRANITTTSEEK